MLNETRQYVIKQAMGELDKKKCFEKLYNIWMCLIASCVNLNGNEFRISLFSNAGEKTAQLSMYYIKRMGV